MTSTTFFEASFHWRSEKTTNERRTVEIPYSSASWPSSYNSFFFENFHNTISLGKVEIRGWGKRHAPLRGNKDYPEELAANVISMIDNLDAMKELRVADIDPMNVISTGLLNTCEKRQMFMRAQNWPWNNSLNAHCEWFAWRNFMPHSRRGG